MYYHPMTTYWQLIEEEDAETARQLESVLGIGRQELVDCWIEYSPWRVPELAGGKGTAEERRAALIAQRRKYQEKDEPGAQPYAETRATDDRNRMAKSEPKWLEEFKLPQALHRLHGQKVSMPSYVKRWLVVYGNKHPRELIPEILEAAMLNYFDQTYRPPAFSGHDGREYLDYLICGRYVNGNEAQLCEELLAERADVWDVVQKVAYGPVVICVSNGAYGYFFLLDKAVYRVGEESVSNPGPFLNWVLGNWPGAKLGKSSFDGPVIYVGKGWWPLHPRLTPGHPRSGNALEYEPPPPDGFGRGLD